MAPSRCVPSCALASTASSAGLRGSSGGDLLTTCLLSSRSFAIFLAPRLARHLPGDLVLTVSLDDGFKCDDLLERVVATPLCARAAATSALGVGSRRPVRRSARRLGPRGRRRTCRCVDGPHRRARRRGRRAATSVGRAGRPSLVGHCACTSGAGHARCAAPVRARHARTHRYEPAAARLRCGAAELVPYRLAAHLPPLSSPDRAAPLFANFYHHLVHPSAARRFARECLPSSTSRRRARCAAPPATTRRQTPTLPPRPLAPRQRWHVRRIPQRSRELGREHVLGVRRRAARRDADPARAPALQAVVVVAASVWAAAPRRRRRRRSKRSRAAFLAALAVVACVARAARPEAAPPVVGQAASCTAAKVGGSARVDRRIATTRCRSGLGRRCQVGRKRAVKGGRARGRRPPRAVRPSFFSHLVSLALADTLIVRAQARSATIDFVCICRVVRRQGALPGLTLSVLCSSR